MICVNFAVSHSHRFHKSDFALLLCDKGTFHKYSYKSSQNNRKYRHHLFYRVKCFCHADIFGYKFSARYYSVDIRVQLRYLFYSSLYLIITRIIREFDLRFGFTVRINITYILIGVQPYTLTLVVHCLI